MNFITYIFTYIMHILDTRSWF